MKPEYAAWVNEHCPTYEKAFGNCRYIATLMAKAFPELRLVRGFFHSVAWGQRGHWWCVAADDSIVDPTAHQFPPHNEPAAAMPVECYEEFTGSDKDLPTGVCAECGGPTFNYASFCSDACHDATVAELNASLDAGHRAPLWNLPRQP